jgi:hypothetical protein
MQILNTKSIRIVLVRKWRIRRELAALPGKVQLILAGSALFSQKPSLRFFGNS